MRLALIVPIILLSMFGGTAVAAECDTFSATVAVTDSPPSHAVSLKKTLKLVQDVPSDADTVFIGDSLFEQWKTLQDDMPGHKVWDFAVGGDTTQNMIWRMDHADLSKVSPSTVVILGGTNNLSDPGTKGCGVFAGVKALVTKARVAWPDATIFVMGLPPRGADFKAYNDERLELNGLIRNINSIDANAFPVMFDDDKITCGQYSNPALEPNEANCGPAVEYKCENYQPGNLHFLAPGYVIFHQMLSDVSKLYLKKNLFE